VVAIGTIWLAVTPLPRPQVKSVSDDWRATLAFCAMHTGRLKTREREFLRSLAHCEERAQWPLLSRQLHRHDPTRGEE
jgi:hypothetical protein